VLEGEERGRVGRAWVGSRDGQGVGKGEGGVETVGQVLRKVE
jgi:hypothetical protein